MRMGRYKVEKIAWRMMCRKIGVKSHGCDTVFLRKSFETADKSRISDNASTRMHSKNFKSEIPNLKKLPLLRNSSFNLEERKNDFLKNDSEVDGFFVFEEFFWKFITVNF